MSFGSSGFGGFGQNNQQNNQQQSTGFGGFGTNTNNNTSGGFGSSGFGASTNNNSGSIFGGGNTSSGFGSTPGFGNNSTSSPFGQAKPAFGQPASTGGGIFGSTNTNTNTSGGFGGFGSTANNTTTNTGFGGTSTGFGGNTTTSGFGSNTGSSIFGGGNTSNTTGFGSTGTTTGFGSNTGTGFGSTANAAPSTQNNGTGSVPFTEHTEKDGTGTNKYQNITCLPAYQNFSVEELRSVDYAQGRKHGNANGQAGAFGTSTGFGGGFGQTNTNTTGGFGSTNNATSGGIFGQQQNNTSGGFGSTNNSGFGSNTGGGLFGAKPAGTGIFGNTNTTTPSTGSGIFGNSGNTNTNTGFGSTNTTGGFGANNNTGSSIFGQTQNKPAFGASTTGSTGFGSTGGFGQTNNAAGGSIFGQNNSNNNTSGGLFGNTNNTNTGSAFGGFGQNNNNNQQQQNTGSVFGGFGQNQNKPATGFGQPAANTGSSIFGQTPQQNNTGSLFGNTQNNNQGSSIFGQKPTTTGTGLFGSTPATNTTPSLFGNTQQQGNNLFGQNNNQQKPNPFGQTTNNTGSLFGGSLGGNNQQQGNSLFGNTQNQQSAFGGNSLFGGSTQQNQQQQPQQLTTSIMSTNPYGNEHLFANLGSPQQAVGPLATPLSSSQKARKPAPLPTYKLNPSASSRLITPQKRTGFGFDYSNYGTPGSAFSSSSSPYTGSLLSSGRFGNTLGRSLSSTSLVRSSSSSDSILNPNAFSTGGLKSGSAGSLKKLRINRNLRVDLFGPGDSAAEPTRSSPLKKSVSFGGEEHDQQGAITNGETSKALVRVQDDDSSTPSAEEQGYLRSSGSRQSPRTNGVSQPEMQQVKGKELAVVPEDRPAPISSQSKASSAAEQARLRQEDMEPGEYYTHPEIEELRKMSRKELSNMKDFVVGREGCGEIKFHDVDLTDVNLDDIIGDIVRIETRSATVYAEHAAHKPPVGKDLNVPATVTLENSWPRSRGGRVPVFERKGPKFEKHLQRLQRVEGTEFIEYKAETGQWIFGVEHFSTYALDYSDNDSIMSTPSRAQHPHEDDSMVSNGTNPEQDSNVDDTFEFRSSRALPGAFDQDEQMYDDYGRDNVADEHQDLFSDDGIVQGHGLDDRRDSSVFDDTAPMNDEGDEESFQKHSPNFAASLKPKSILKASTGFRTSILGTPAKKPVIGADWASQLQRTISPKKQDRQALRESQGIFATAPFTQSVRDRPQVNFAPSTKLGTNNKPIATTIDLMHSLFGESATKAGSPRARQAGKAAGLQWPVSKRSTHDQSTMTKEDRKFHDSSKPSWTTDGTLVFSSSGNQKDTTLVKATASITTGGKHVHLTRLPTNTAASTSMLAKQQEISNITLEAGVPVARVRSDVSFAELASAVQQNDSPALHEKSIWQLASILFDQNIQDQSDRKARLHSFWQEVTAESARKHVDSTIYAEEKAIAWLSMHDIWSASETLMTGRDFRLATMIAQIGGDTTMREDMIDQIKRWREADVIPEMTPAIRTLYELLAGNTCTSNGKGGSVGRENRAETFNISSHFGLDWKRAFGLKLWYGVTSDSPSTSAIQAFEADLAEGNEKVKPVPWFVEEKLDLPWSLENAANHEDMLWSLLKLYASNEGALSDVDLGTMLTPESLTGNPVDARLCFQLYQALSTLKIASFDPESSTASKADIITSLLILQLSSSSETLTSAVLVSLYLTQASARKQTIQTLLNRYAGAITDAIFTTLTTDLKIPASWIHNARALHARAVHNDEAQAVRHLLLAGGLGEASNRFKTIVAPRAVIEEDIDVLKGLLDLFEQHDVQATADWERGGALYREYVTVLEAGSPEEREDGAERLAMALERAGAKEGKDAEVGLEERVAWSEMWALVDKIRRQGDDDIVDQATQSATMGWDNQVLQEALELSEDYYKSVFVSVGA